VSEKSEEKKASSIRANPKLTRSPAKDYFNPNINQVAVEVSSDDKVFLPSSDGPVSEICVNIPSSELTLVHNSSCVVDCGFSLTLPAGYRCRVESLHPSLFVSLVGCPRFKLNVFNTGDKLRLIDRQKIAKIWIEPIYLFEWIVKGET